MSFRDGPATLTASTTLSRGTPEFFCRKAESGGARAAACSGVSTYNGQEWEGDGDLKRKLLLGIEVGTFY